MDRAQLIKLLLGEFTLWRLVRSLLFIYGSFALYVFFFSDCMLFLPQAPGYSDTDQILRLPVNDQEEIAALHLKNPDATYTLLYSHGNAEDLADIDPILNILYSAGFNVLAYDYRGYGTSDGRPSEHNTYADIRAAYRYLTEEQGVTPAEIILFGRSVGGGPTIDLATQEPVAGVILESTFTQAFRVVVPFPLLPFDKFYNRAKLPHIDAPVLIIHGTADVTIPFKHGQQLFDVAAEPKMKYWVEGATHNDLVWVAGEDYPQAIRRFSQAIEQAKQD
ncbi:MAG: alpha/beta hydrolase [Spirulina sp. SIO3F2]|nr:alpha/beta hydrolase [Spirulina sp. SIO3F2]